MLNKKIKYSLLKYLIIFFTTFSICSCNNFFENKDYKKTLEKNEKLARNREEARLLVETAEISLKIIAISEKVQESDYNDSRLALKFNIEHSEIYSYLNEIAKEKLILIPSTNLDSPEENLDDYGDINISQNYIETVIPLLIEQIDVLDKLYNSTKDIDFRVLVVNIKSKLKNQLNLAESSL